MLIPQERSRWSSDTSNKRRNCSKPTRSRHSRCNRDSSHLAVVDLAAVVVVADIINRSLLRGNLYGHSTRWD
jgi:hypothetical protein